MGFVKRKANTKAKICPDGLQELKSNFLSDIAAVVQLEEVPPSLVINWDHTGLKYVPLSLWTMAKEGSKKVPIAGLEDDHCCLWGYNGRTFSSTATNTPR